MGEALGGRDLSILILNERVQVKSKLAHTLPYSSRVLAVEWGQLGSCSLPQVCFAQFASGQSSAGGCGLSLWK